ncbi:YihY/virulence factor BrkB family protein [Paraflavisolibacter sp. H34]|uniref:YihY/virulence factor BrkB family protein n=1 Tax=Huijunlia imazamoxiresistens TaxID=3127457 RepID=UPI0030191ED1
MSWRMADIKHIPRLLKGAFAELMANDPLRMAGATAFFTTFALPPILLIIIQVLGLVFDPRTISRELLQELETVIGPASVRQVIGVLIAFRRMSQDWLLTSAGFLFLLFVATTLFRVIKSSLNQIWKIRLTGKVSFGQQLRSRLVAVVVILVTGVLFVITLVAEGAQAFLGSHVSKFSPLAAIYLNSALNYVISLLVVTVWFALLFRYLPDGRQEWNVTLTGAFVTGLLFNIGKLLIRWLLNRSNISSIYGASGSIVLLLLFVFYSSLILYYGAAFTKVWGTYRRKPIKLLSHAIHYRLVQEPY